MKLTFLIILFTTLNAFSMGVAQTIDLKLKNSTLEDAFSSIKEQTGYQFIYKESALNNVSPVNLDLKDKSLESTLELLLKNQPLEYQIHEGTVVIRPRRKATVESSVKPVQQRPISGKVIDEEGNPLAGVTVTVKGTEIAESTDNDGGFEIKADIGEVLVFTYIGFTPQEYVLQSTSFIEVKLQTDQENLDEVIVIGYGTATRRSITGAVDQVGSATFENRPVSNAVQALQGASANLIIQQKSMNPNSNDLNINIRGVSTMGNNDPLIVIDGLISTANTLNNINQNDIESVSVLKDAGSAAIYGSRSANGVILVTTKQGARLQKPTIRYSGLVGYQDPKILFQPVEGWQNAMYRNQANMNAGSTPLFTPEQIRDLHEHRNEEYWFFDKIIQKGLQQNHNLNISGGSENTTYMVSTGYLNQESNFVGGFGMERYNFRTNLSTEYNRLKLTALTAYNRRKERTIAGGTGNVIINSSRIPPYYYYRFEEDGKYLINNIIGDDNTMAKLKEGGFENKAEDNFIGSLNLDYSIIEGLTAKGLVGIDLTQHHRFRRDIQVPLYSANDLENPVANINPDRLTEDYNNKRYTLSTQFLLDYNKTIDNRHNLSGLLGASNESYTYKASRLAFIRTDPDLGLPTADDSEPHTGNFTSNGTEGGQPATIQTSITSVFGRFRYNYMDKYYGDLSFRYDGSSKFAKENRWGFFPSFSAAWRISEEEFMGDYGRNTGDVKLRGSYGVLGNQNVVDYSYLSVYQVYPNSYVFNDQPVPGTGFTYGNHNLTWEKSGNFNIGIDAGFFNNDLYVSLDYFNKRTWDILLAPEISSVFGTSAAHENAGEMQNQGWEATLNYRLLTGEVKHNFNLNFSDSKNKVTDFGGKERIDQSDQMFKLIRKGEALGSYYGYKTDGYFQSVEEITNSAQPIGALLQPGDVKYVDQNNDGVIDEKDRVVLGNAFPRYTFGFTYDLEWKNFDFSFLLQGVGKRDMYVRGELIEPFHSNYSYAIYTHQLDFWTPTNPNARWPRLIAPGSTSTSNNWGRSGTDIYLLDGAYLRVKNITVGYTLSKTIAQRFGIESLRVSANAQNPLTLFTKNSFVDPETSEFGNNMGGIGSVNANSARNYPTLIYYGFGLDIQF